MAETKKRSELLQGQIERLMSEAPKPYTAEERAKIMLGRGKVGTAEARQKDLDAGRALIDARDAAIKAHNESIERLNTQLDKAVESEAALGSKGKADDRAEAREAEKRSPWGIVAQAASGVPSGAAGYVAGRYVGGAMTREADEGQALKNRHLGQVAQDRIAGLTTREGARAGTERAGAMPPRSSAGRFISRAGAPTTIGGLMAAKGGLLMQGVDENDPLLNQSIDQGFASGMVGGGVGLAEKGLAYGFNPRVAPDASALAIIESNQLRRNGLNAVAPSPAAPPPPGQLPPPSAPAGPMPGSRDFLAEQAKGMGLKVTTRMTKAQIADAMAESIKATGSKRARVPRLPKGGGAAALAGGLAYALTPDNAQASTGQGGGSSQVQGLTNAGIAGGTAYGASRLMDKMGTIGRAVVGGFGEAMLPSTIDAMTDYSPDDLAHGRNYLARNVPAWARAGAVEDAYQMAQVPERNPVRTNLDNLLDEFEAYSSAE